MVARNPYRGVGFIVQPSSRDVSLNVISNPICDTDRPFAISESGATEVVYTYSVEWIVTAHFQIRLTPAIEYTMGNEMG